MQRDLRKGIWVAMAILAPTLSSAADPPAASKRAEKKKAVQAAGEEVKEAREELKEAKEEVKEAKGDLKEAKEDLKEARKEAKEARKEAKEARSELADEQRARFRARLEAIKSGKLGKEELAKINDELRTTRAERRRAWRAAERERLGELAKAPAVRAAIKVHSRRMARLTRIEWLARAEGKKPIAERAQKAIAKEQERYEKHMALLKAKGGAE